jgi:hypothetical protein
MISSLRALNGDQVLFTASLATNFTGEPNWKPRQPAGLRHVCQGVAGTPFQDRSRSREVPQLWDIEVKDIPGNTGTRNKRYEDALTMGFESHL